MKKFMMKNVLSLCLAAIALSMVLASCEKDEDKLPSYADFVDINITRCERVGSVLMIDYTVKNKKDETLNLTLNGQEVTDNTGTTYVSMWSDHIAHISIGNNAFSDKSNATITPNGEVAGQIKVYDFDVSNLSTNARLVIAVAIEGKNLSDQKYERNGITILDNRVLANGVQTNDTRMVYQVTSCTVEGGDAYLNFNITNNTGISLREFGMGYMHGGEATAYDDLNNSYNCSIRFGNNDWYHYGETDLFLSGSTLQASFRVANLRESANKLTVIIGASATNYVFEDGSVRFLTIPIINK